MTIVTVIACQHFEQQVARTPDAVALSCGARRLTYAQLNARANQLAQVLRRRGVGPDILVGVALSRSPEMVVGLLAVWKAGGAYVPLDPTYPPDRLAFMISDAGLQRLLVDRHSETLLASALANTAVDRLRLDEAWREFADEATDNPAPLATAADLAYVMYTSGSTGQPKGAMIEHGGLANYLHWAIGAYGFRCGGVVPVHSSISFDLTVTSLYPPLLVGGQVELLPEDAGAESLLAALRGGNDYDVVKITPAHLELLRQQLRPADMVRMCRAFVIGGESLLADRLREWRRHAPTTRFFNEYGPTETVVGCCVHEVLPGDADSGAVPIGRPIDNTALYVLDDDLRPLPPGATGELYIGGAGVARGYLNRPQHSAERFVADRLGGGQGGRLYKTGDLARCRVDGCFDYLGRTDDQVKVRGYRIELGEVEVGLTAHGQVQSCAVLAPDTDHGERQLVAYVVPASGLPPTAGELRRFLAGRLPEFMVPTQFHLVDALPLTRNGKVDRHALADLANDRAAMDEATDEENPPEFGLPRTPVEERLVAIWRNLLNRERIGVHEDIFELGARSLLAARAVTQMRAAFDVDLQLRHLFEQPTIAGLATVIDGLAWLTRAQAVNTGNRKSRERADVELEEVEL